MTNSDNPKQRREQRQQAVTLRSKPKGVPQIPYNSLDRLTEALVNTIDPSLDISVQLTGNLCGFLHLVPSRLGTNKALDAATDALVTAYTNYRSGHRKADSIVLSKHSRALNALSSCLNDPVTAYSSETLCAIMLLLTCQVVDDLSPGQYRKDREVLTTLVMDNYTDDAAMVEPLGRRSTDFEKSGSFRPKE